MRILSRYPTIYVRILSEYPSMYVRILSKYPSIYVRILSKYPSVGDYAFNPPPSPSLGINHVASVKGFLVLTL